MKRIALTCVAVGAVQGIFIFAFWIASLEGYVAAGMLATGAIALWSAILGVLYKTRPKIGSGNQSSPEHSDAPRRSAAQK